MLDVRGYVEKKKIMMGNGLPSLPPIEVCLDINVF